MSIYFKPQQYPILSGTVKKDTTNPFLYSTNLALATINRPLNDYLVDPPNEKQYLDPFNILAQRDQFPAMDTKGFTDFSFDFNARQSYDMPVYGFGTFTVDMGNSTQSTRASYLNRQPIREWEVNNRELYRITQEHQYVELIKADETYLKTNRKVYEAPAFEYMDQLNTLFAFCQSIKRQILDQIDYLHGLFFPIGVFKLRQTMATSYGTTPLSANAPPLMTEANIWTKRSMPNSMNINSSYSIWAQTDMHIDQVYKIGNYTLNDQLDYNQLLDGQYDVVLQIKEYLQLVYLIDYFLLQIKNTALDTSGTIGNDKIYDYITANGTFPMLQRQYKSLLFELLPLLRQRDTLRKQLTAAQFAQIKNSNASVISSRTTLTQIEKDYLTLDNKVGAYYAKLNQVIKAAAQGYTDLFSTVMTTFTNQKTVTETKLDSFRTFIAQSLLTYQNNLSEIQQVAQTYQLFDDIKGTFNSFVEMICPPLEISLSASYILESTTVPSHYTNEQYFVTQQQKVTDAINIYKASLQQVQWTTNYDNALMIDWVAYWLNMGKNSQTALDYNAALAANAAIIPTTTTTGGGLDDATRTLLLEQLKTKTRDDLSLQNKNQFNVLNNNLGLFIGANNNMPFQSGTTKALKEINNVQGLPTPLSEPSVNSPQPPKITTIYDDGSTSSTAYVSNASATFNNFQATSILTDQEQREIYMNGYYLSSLQLYVSRNANAFVNTSSVQPAELRRIRDTTIKSFNRFYFYFQLLLVRFYLMLNIYSQFQNIGYTQQAAPPLGQSNIPRLYARVTGEYITYNQLAVTQAIHASQRAWLPELKRKIRLLMNYAYNFISVMQPVIQDLQQRIEQYSLTTQTYQNFIYRIYRMYYYFLCNGQYLQQEYNALELAFSFEQLSLAQSSSFVQELQIINLYNLAESTYTRFLTDFTIGGCYSGVKKLNTTMSTNLTRLTTMMNMDYITYIIYLRDYISFIDDSFAALYETDGTITLDSISTKLNALASELTSFAAAYNARDVADQDPLIMTKLSALTNIYDWMLNRNLLRWTLSANDIPQSDVNTFYGWLTAVDFNTTQIMTLISCFAQFFLQTVQGPFITPSLLHSFYQQIKNAMSIQLSVYMSTPEQNPQLYQNNQCQEWLITYATFMLQYQQIVQTKGILYLDNVRLADDNSPWQVEVFPLANMNSYLTQFDAIQHQIFQDANSRSMIVKYYNLQAYIDNSAYAALALFQTQMTSLSQFWLLFTLKLRALTQASTLQSDTQRQYKNQLLYNQVAEGILLAEFIASFFGVSYDNSVNVFKGRGANAGTSTNGVDTQHALFITEDFYPYTKYQRRFDVFDQSAARYFVTQIDFVTLTQLLDQAAAGISVDFNQAITSQYPWSLSTSSGAPSTVAPTYSYFTQKLNVFYAQFQPAAAMIATQQNLNIDPQDPLAYLRIIRKQKLADLVSRQQTLISEITAVIDDPSYQQGTAQFQSIEAQLNEALANDKLFKEITNTFTRLACIIDNQAFNQAHLCCDPIHTALSNGFTSVLQTYIGVQQTKTTTLSLGQTQILNLLFDATTLLAQYNGTMTTMATNVQGAITSKTIYPTQIAPFIDEQLVGWAGALAPYATQCQIPSGWTYQQMIANLDFWSKTPSDYVGLYGALTTLLLNADGSPKQLYQDMTSIAAQPLTPQIISIVPQINPPPSTIPYVITENQFTTLYRALSLVDHNRQFIEAYQQQRNLIPAATRLKPYYFRFYGLRYLVPKTSSNVYTEDESISAATSISGQNIGAPTSGATSTISVNDFSSFFNPIIKFSAMRYYTLTQQTVLGTQTQLIVKNLCDSPVGNNLSRYLDYVKYPGATGTANAVVDIVLLDDTRSYVITTLNPVNAITVQAAINNLAPGLQLPYNLIVTQLSANSINVKPQIIDTNPPQPLTSTQRSNRLLPQNANVVNFVVDQRQTTFSCVDLYYDSYQRVSQDAAVQAIIDTVDTQTSTTVTPFYRTTANVTYNLEPTMYYMVNNLYYHVDQTPLINQNQTQTSSLSYLSSPRFVLDVINPHERDKILAIYNGASTISEKIYFKYNVTDIAQQQWRITAENIRITHAEEDAHILDDYYDNTISSLFFIEQDVMKSVLSTESVSLQLNGLARKKYRRGFAFGGDFDVFMGFIFNILSNAQQSLINDTTLVQFGSFVHYYRLERVSNLFFKMCETMFDRLVGIAAQ